MALFDQTNSITPGKDRGLGRSASGQAPDIPEDPPHVRRTYYTETRMSRITRRETRHYYTSHDARKPVISATAQRIATNTGDAGTVRAMLDLAQARGWTTIQVRGAAAFRQEAAIQATIRGMEVLGYKLAARDQQEADRRLAATGKGQQAAGKQELPPAAPATSGRQRTAQQAAPQTQAAGTVPPAEPTAKGATKDSTRTAAAAAQPDPQATNGTQYQGTMMAAATAQTATQKRQTRQAAAGMAP